MNYRNCIAGLFGLISVVPGLLLGSLCSLIALLAMFLFPAVGYAFADSCAISQAPTAGDMRSVSVIVSLREFTLALISQ